MNPTALRRFPLLRDLNSDDLDELTRCTRTVPFRKDDEVLAQGQRNGALYLVLDGLLHVRRRIKTRDVLLGRLEPGAFFGEISLFDPGPTTASVRALSEGELLEIGRPALARFRERRPAAAATVLMHLLEEMSKRLRRTDERLADSVLWGGLLRE
jgi:CRP-like cAMP-binding protein